jgi:spore photoproduct lyase
MKSYCYVGRYNHDKVYVNENVDDILTSIDNWQIKQSWPKKANQCDPKYYTIDIGCSTDVALHQKHYDWKKVFTFFNEHLRLKSTFATKYPSLFDPTDYKLEKDKHRIRISLMPQEISSILEPKTDSIEARIASIPRLNQHMEVHINFSPIVYYDGWLSDYEKLFRDIKQVTDDIQSECIFLTYNEKSKERVSDEVNALVYRPDIQEYKESQCDKGGDNIRYKIALKQQMINEFKDLYAKYFSLSGIRYIF